MDAKGRKDFGTLHKGKFVKAGKVKEIYDLGSELEFFFTDQISVFDKIIPTPIAHKGETLCRTSAHWFEMGKKIGINSHFVNLAAPNRMIVKKVDIIRDYDKISSKTKNYLIPLEFIVRYYVAGSLNDRIKRKEVDARALGFKAVPKYGDVIPEPMFEVTTKLEKVDRLLDDKEAAKISGTSKSEFADIKEMILKIDEKIARDVKKRGLIHVDGKKEFAFDAKREPMLIDTFGTADEDRWWDAAEYDKGNFVELSKEFVRQHYRKTGYHAALEGARKEKKPEPDIPALPANVADDVSKLYINIFERLTGENFR